MIDINTIISLLSWRTFFDVPIIGMMIFILYRTMRSSGSWRIGMGVIIAILIYLLARLFRFSGIEWIFNNISNIALIAIIIIFQPEIRKIFERTASTLKVKKLLSEGSHYSFLISEAVFQLASQAWGAIIILPGKEGIESRISGGVDLNAKISVPIIVSIFDHHSPGHDGAIIIENGLISRFGLRLPLSTSSRFNNEFGTRHHASLGLSEVSDALVITVSEERGVISVFHEGGYEMVADNLELQRRIEDHWKDISGFSPIRKVSRRKGLLLLETFASIVIAFVLWLSIMMSVSQRKELVATVPIEYRLGENAIIVGEKPATSRIKISGTAADIDTIKPEGLRAVIDLAKAAPGNVTVSMARKYLNLPVGGESHRRRALGDYPEASQFRQAGDDHKAAAYRRPSRGLRAEVRGCVAVSYTCNVYGRQDRGR